MLLAHSIVGADPSCPPSTWRNDNRTLSGNKVEGMQSSRWLLLLLSGACICSRHIMRHIPHATREVTTP